MPAVMVIQLRSSVNSKNYKGQTSSNTFVATDLSNSITPKFANSKINVDSVAGHFKIMDIKFLYNFFRIIGSGSFSSI